tara:strand:- start:4895 stop:5212 length:318 start_codon:yes stop_codon:yes gene_type:complete
MSFEEAIAAGFAEALSFAGQPFTISGRAESFTGVFRGEQAPVTFDLQGFDPKRTDQVSSTILQFNGTPPLINLRLTKSTGEVYMITGVDSPDSVNYDLMLQRVNA